MFGSVGFEGLKGLIADDMFDPAGVFCGYLRAYAQSHQPIREKGMPFIYFFSNLQSLVQQGDVSLLIHVNIAVKTQIFHGNTDAGLGERELTGNINRTDLPLTLFQDQDRFQVVLSRFVDFHNIVPPLRKSKVKWE